MVEEMGGGRRTWGEKMHGRAGTPRLQRLRIHHKAKQATDHPGGGGSLIPTVMS